jgi:hypothetical protein
LIASYESYRSFYDFFPIKICIFDFFFYQIQKKIDHIFDQTQKIRSYFSIKHRKFDHIFFDQKFLFLFLPKKSCFCFRSFKQCWAPCDGVIESNYFIFLKFYFYIFKSLYLMFNGLLFIINKDK